MARIRYNKHPLLKKQSRCSKLRSHLCLRTEYLLSSILIGLLAMTVTLGSSAIVNAGYELVETRDSLAKIKSQNEILRLETAQLKSPQRIQAIAVGQLGMVNPETVYIRDKDVLGRKAVK